jgi:hypothetical protein
MNTHMNLTHPADGIQGTKPPGQSSWGEPSRYNRCQCEPKCMQCDRDVFLYLSLGML